MICDKCKKDFEKENMIFYRLSRNAKEHIICFGCYKKITVDIKNAVFVPVRFNFKYDILTFGCFRASYHPNFCNLLLKKRFYIKINVKDIFFSCKNFDLSFSKTVSHEFIHFCIHKYIGMSVSKKFDRIANRDINNMDVF